MANHYLWTDGGVVGTFVELNGECRPKMTNISFISKCIIVSQNEFLIEIFEILGVDYQMLISSGENENSYWPKNAIF